MRDKKGRIKKGKMREKGESNQRERKGVGRREEGWGRKKERRGT